MAQYGNWVKSWLSDRWQKLCLDGTYSHWTQVWSEVPQGSVLGPVLFLIRINDLDTSTSSNVLKFADDINFIVLWITNQMVTCYSTEDLGCSVKMGRDLEMSFNVDKCKFLHYGKGNIEYKYSMCGQQLDEVETEKDLGIIFLKN